MDDDAGAEKADAGQNSLNDAADGVGSFFGIAKRFRQHHHHCCREAYQSKGSQSNRFAVQIAIEADQPAGKRGGAQTQHDLRPVEQCGAPLKAPYFGRRPIM